MAWNVDQIYSLLKFLIRKNQAGGLTSDNFFYSWNSEQKAYMSDLLGKWQNRNNGKTGLNTGLIEDETILQKLSIFTKPATLTIAAGKSSKPSDFIYRLAMRINDKDCYKINHNQIATVKDSVIDAPSITTDTYYFVEYEGYYLFLPTAVTSAALDYIAVPNDIRWAYTYDANSRQVYSASGLTGLPVIFGGVGYTTPTITFSAPATGGVQATATLTVVGGVITAVVMTNIGNGYAGLTPTFTITGSSTTPATFGSPLVSVQPQWSDLDVVEISKRSLKSLGISFKDSDFINYGQSAISSGD